MAISMSGASIQDDSRQTLMSSTVDSSFAGSNANGGGAALAGVTASFASNVTSAIDSYKADIEATINQMCQADSSDAFKGASLQSALQSFLDAVKQVANSYLQKLTDAENQIINSVNAAYASQDTDLSSNLGSDQASLESMQ